MARPQKNTVDYFPHYIGNGKKMSFIESKYGNDGYATWFKILETLAETEYHFLNLSKQMEVMFLSTKCKVDEEKLLNIINDLVILEVFSPKAWEYKILWSENFMKSISDAYRKRESKTHDLDSLFRHLSINNVVSDVGNGERKEKEKEIKEKESKVNENINVADAKTKTFDDRVLDFKKSLFPFVDTQGGKYTKKIVEDFFEYWSEPNKSKTKMRWEMEKTFDNARRLSKWVSYDYNFNNNGKQQNTNTREQRANEVDEFRKHNQSIIAAELSKYLTSDQN